MLPFGSCAKEQQKGRASSIGIPESIAMVTWIGVCHGINIAFILLLLSLMSSSRKMNREFLYLLSCIHNLTQSPVLSEYHTHRSTRRRPYIAGRNGRFVAMQETYRSFLPCMLLFGWERAHVDLGEIDQIRVPPSSVGFCLFLYSLSNCILRETTTRAEEQGDINNVTLGLLQSMMRHIRGIYDTIDEVQFPVFM